jgi:hypothetical protein
VHLSERDAPQVAAGATTNLPNLFLAGDYCRTLIDVVTVEGPWSAGCRRCARSRLRWRARDDGRRAQLDTSALMQTAMNIARMPWHIGADLANAAWSAYAAFWRGSAPKPPRT